MKAFTKLRSTAAPLLDKGKLMANVDTDMIIPKQFLKTTERVGLSEGKRLRMDRPIRTLF
jgi:3-isopropylmalate/(R)-2-methylmalate dehydratase small subunit